MKISTCLVLFTFLIGPSGKVLAQLTLRTEFFASEEEAQREFDQLFSHEEGLRRLDQMRQALESFRMLTEQYGGRFAPGELRSVGNTAGDTQNLGFYNWPKSVEGTLRKQEYELRKAKYELAECKYAAEETRGDKLTRLRLAYENAESELQAFWNAFRISD